MSNFYDKDEIKKTILQNVDVHYEDEKTEYIIGAFYINELVNEILKALNKDNKEECKND